jgi:ADP-heptose:LPS heptosyltransferase
LPGSDGTALVLRALGLGDFFTGLPALAMLRNALPGHRIVLALPDPLVPLARLAGTVDATCHGHELEPLRHAPLQPDLAIDLHGNGPASRALLLACSPRRLVAFNDGEGPQWDEDEHEVARWCRLVAEGLPAPDVPWPGVAGALPVPDGVRAPSGLTVLHCGAKAAARRWPVARFAEVARVLRARGHDVVITAAAPETQPAESIARASGTRALTTVSLLELVALVARARLVISGDTGVAHVASNYRTPSVVLFGPIPPSRWGPPGDPRHRVLWHGDGIGDPHGARPDPALLRIEAAEVIAAAEKALAAAGEAPVNRDG